MVRITPALAADLNGRLGADLAEDGRLGLVKRYLAGDHDLPYMPKTAKAEFKMMAQRSIVNWTPLLSDTFAKGLFVDGYRPARAAENAAPWAYWQANGLDARQSITHRGAIEYGTSYVMVLRGALGARRMPVIKPLSPLKVAAWYRDADDEYPEVALRRLGTTFDGTRLIELLDADNVYTFALPKDGSDWRLSSTAAHGMGVTPLVRFRDRLDGESPGIIRPIVALQDRVNEIAFSTAMALHYASFRQRWVTGLAIPEDENGNPIEPFQSAVDRLWVAEDDTVKFGDFAQTDTAGHDRAYQTQVRTLAAISQVSPNVLTGDLVNVSAEALAQMQDTTQRKIGAYETNFGESWETVLRLAAYAAGDQASAEDTSAEVRWRDTEARSLAQTVDALGKMAQMLQVPVEALWERVPGVTDQDVTRWRALRDADPLATLTAEITRQSADAQRTLTATPAPNANPDDVVDAEA